MTQSVELPGKTKTSTHPLHACLADLVAGLRSLEREPITSAKVADLMAHVPLTPEALAPYVMWNQQTYTRNLIYRDNFFEVLALCWLPGQHTPIHSHAGQLGWVTLVQGELETRNYRFVRSNRVDPSMPRDRKLVEVELIGAASSAADGSVATVDRRQTTHQIANLEKSSLGSVSLHIYSKPIDCCAAFNELERCIVRRHLHYYSENGILTKSG